MLTQGDIKALKEYYDTTIYSATKTQQLLDLDYYNDRFNVKDIVKPPVTVMRTGRARRLIDGPADHIITDNPQAFRINIRDSKEEDLANERITTMLNTKWLQAFKRQNPNAYKQVVKYLLLMGEAWGQIVHNPNFKRGSSEDMLPVMLRIPDPIVVLASPNEDADGVPENIILFFERAPWIVKQMYPDKFTNPLHAGEKGKKKTVTFIEFWHEGQRYFEADGEILVNDGNPYKRVTFVHKLSGFGSETHDGKMEELVVGRLKFSHDTLRRECAIISSLDHIITFFANAGFDVQGDDQHPVPADFWDNYKIGLGTGRTLPPNIKIIRAITEIPDAQVFQYLNSINLQLEMEDPLPMEGVTVGTSARQQDMTLTSALRRYASILESTESLFATIFGMGLRIIDKVPMMLPSELKRGDLMGNYEVTVQLKAKDSIDDDRRATLGSRLVAQGEIDMETNLIEFKGYTRERAREIMVADLRDKVLFESPDIAMLIGMRAAEKSGMAEDLKMLREQRQLAEKGGLGTPPSPTEQRRRTGEAQTQTGFEQLDVALTAGGQRSPPERFTRG